MDKRELAFMGKVTAGVTHEMNNVLAIIKESAGLMEDILTMTKSDEFKHRDRFLKRIAGLSEQIARGVELSRRLNRFAHSMDEPEAMVNLNELLAQLTYLTARFARLRQVRLELAPPDDAILVRTDPFRLLMVLVSLVESVLGRSTPGGTVTISGGATDSRVGIRIALEAREMLEQPDVVPACLDDVISDLRLTVDDFGGTGVALKFPAEQFQYVS